MTVGNMGLVEIENRKHFNVIIHYLRKNSDILLNIDQLYRYASVHGDMNMLRNAIRLKAPELHEAITQYIITFNRASLDENTGYLSRVRNNPSIVVPAFLSWAMERNLIPEGTNLNMMGAKPIKPLSEYKKIVSPPAPKKKTLPPQKKTNTANLPSCPYCHKKFRPESGETLATHTCKTAKKKRKSVWVISGGGANGIRNKR